MCCQNWHLFCHCWLDFRFPWFKWCPQLRSCKYHGSFYRDRYSWVNCAFPRLMTCTQLGVIFRSTFLNWYGQIHTSILKIHNFTQIRTYGSLFTIQCSTRIRFWSPLCLRHGLNNWTMIKPLLYMDIVHILQTDKHINGFSYSKINFAKLSKLMPCINKLYLFKQYPIWCSYEMTKISWWQWRWCRQFH